MGRHVRHVIQAEGRRGEHAISIIIPHIFYPHFYPPFSETFQRNKARLNDIGARGLLDGLRMAQAGDTREDGLEDE